MKILLPVDGSPYTKRMLGYVAAHEELFGPHHQYLFVTVVTPVPPHVTHFIDRATLQGYYGDEANKVLIPVLKFAAQHGWNAKSTQVEGSAAETLAALAKSENVDLIVMGSHGRTGVGRLLMGSVAENVMRRAECPVLIVKSMTKVEPPKPVGSLP